ncbi:MAG: hypothetical protein AAF127_05435 [Pseudomonadota bacterium]
MMMVFNQFACLTYLVCQSADPFSRARVGAVSEVKMLKAMSFGAVLTGTVAMVIGSQGSDGGSLAIEALKVGDAKIYWSWPMFCGGTGISWAMIVLQR